MQHAFGAFSSAYHLARIIQGVVGEAVLTTQRAEIDHPSLLRP
jgi:hypothetical protein